MLPKRMRSSLSATQQSPWQQTARSAHKTEQYQRRRPIPNKPGMSLSDSIEAALLRSTRVVIADLIEQVLDLPQRGRAGCQLILHRFHWRSIIACVARPCLMRRIAHASSPAGVAVGQRSFSPCENRWEIWIPGALDRGCANACDRGAPTLVTGAPTLCDRIRCANACDLRSAARFPSSCENMVSRQRFR